MAPYVGRVPDLLRKLFENNRTLHAAWLLIAIECIVSAWLLRPWAVGDSWHYLLLAHNLAEGHYGANTYAGFEPDVLRPPGYPLLLWLQLYVFKLPWIAVVGLQLCSYCAIIFALQRYLAGRDINPVPFVVVAALYPFPLLYSAYLLAESWTIVATTAAALLLARRTAAAYMLAGAVAAFGALMRADLLLLPLVLSAVILVLELPHSSSCAVAVSKALAPVFMATLVLAPYSMWNRANFGRLTPLPMAGAVGTSLYLSTWQRQLTWEDTEVIVSGRTDAHIEQIGLGSAVRHINRSIGAPENILAFDPHAYPTNAMKIAAAEVFQRAALDRISADPLSYAKHVLHNSWALWVTKRYPVPWFAAAGLMLSSGAVFFLGVAGMATSIIRPKGWSLPWFFVPVTLYPAAIHLWLHTEARYTAATRPLLMMFAAAFLIWMLKGCSREARSSKAPSTILPS